ncbi:MAG: hypothetical protein FD131_1553 [Rhodocyclaceae bacterium]|nr:MAG: hypothetical protein FD131_1553 [Rhodocyclaceae bacterium]
MNMTTALTTRPTKAQLAGVDLLRIVRINEEIKSVVGVAFKINIMALKVLSNELRVFSQDLRDGMSALTSLIHGCVTEVSLVLQDIRHTALLRRAVELSSGGCGRDVLAAREVENERHAERLARLRKQLRGALDDAGQSFAVPLSQVSGEFDGVVEEIRSSLEALRRSAFFTGN